MCIRYSPVREEDFKTKKLVYLGLKFSFSVIDSKEKVFLTFVFE